MIDLIYGQMSYNCCLLNAFKLKLKHNLKIFLAKFKSATGKEIAEPVSRPVKVAMLRLDCRNCYLSYIDFGRF